VISIVIVLLGLSAIPIGLANAKPPTPTPKPTTSSTDDIADMVMDALGHQPAAPSTTPILPPPG
jgi:hypothetical protein